MNASNSVQCAVVLAVGSPSHHSQLTYNRPQTMLPALGKPLTVRIMDRLYRSGFNHFIVVIGENEGAITTYLGSQWWPNVKVEFVLKSNSTSFSKTLSNVARQYRKPFLITTYNAFTHHSFPDVLLRHHQKYPKALIASGASTTLSKSPHHFFAASDNRQITSISVDASSLSSSLLLNDMAICGQDFVDYLVEHKASPYPNQLGGLFQDYIQQNGLAYIVESSWLLQIESDADLLTLNKYLLDEGHDAHILSEISDTIQIIPPVRIDPQVSIGQGARIGPYVYLESGCSVGYEATIRNALVFQKAVISSRETISGCIISTRIRIQVS